MSATPNPNQVMSTLRMLGDNELGQYAKQKRLISSLARSLCWPSLFLKTWVEVGPSSTWSLTSSAAQVLGFSLISSLREQAMMPDWGLSRRNVGLAVDSEPVWKSW